MELPTLDAASSQAALRQVLEELEERKERKRRQNRMAQRTYRQNQKQRMLALQAAVHSNDSSQGFKSVLVDDPTRRTDCPSEVVSHATSGYATMDECSFELARTELECSPRSSNGSATTNAGFLSSSSTPVLEEAAWTFSPTLGREDVLSPEHLRPHIASPKVPITDRSALHLAVQETSNTMIRFLLAHGADINKQDSHGDTPLHLAAATGNIEVITTLLEHSADPDLADWTGRTPLYAAVERGHQAAVTLLIEAATNIDWKDINGHSALHLAVQIGSETMVSTLLSNGANINA
ncbi:Ankyrin repeat-containing protein 30 [Elsinoe fawcettii]|nr:Ankyrin repeat-containing protein 30 [Elsinoe fawcettii]